VTRQEDQKDLSGPPATTGVPPIPASCHDMSVDFNEDDDHIAIAEAIRAICAKFGDEYWMGCDQDHRFPWEFYNIMAAGGWLGIAMPEEYGGAGRGITEAAIILREVAASGAAMNGCSALHLTIFGLNPVAVFGNDRLKSEFLPKAAAGDLHVAFGVTEPDAGTDTSKITTRADPDGKGGYIVRGRKIWTSKALESEVVLLLVRTGGEGFKGLSLLLADLDRDYVDIRPIPKMGRNAVASCEVAYDGLPVEGWRLVGEEGQGWKYLLHGINPERILLSAESIGIGEAALRKAVAYASEREVFGRKIGANQAISHPLAQAHIQLRSAWNQTQYAAWLYDQGLECGEAANSAKYVAAEAGFFAADRAVQTLGGMGYATEYHVERYFREARLQRIVPVSQEMTLNYIAQQVLKLPRSY
jgi:acyl-CoA dehydrogenase